MAKEHQVRIRGLHSKVPQARLLGPGPWTRDEQGLCALLSATHAADLRVRLQGVVLLGVALQVEVSPPLARTQIRAAQTRKAKALRATTPGFIKQGTKMDEQGRYSLTPEALAMAMAQKNECSQVLDLGCGLGGNAIAFARCGARVIGVELDPQRAQLARHNARIYGVTDRLEIRCGDALAAIPPRFDGLVFCDPPWGRDWKQHPSELERYPLAKALWQRRDQFRGLWLKLPPAFDPKSLPDLQGTQIRIQLYFGESSGDAQSPKFMVLRAQPSTL